MKIHYLQNSSYLISDIFFADGTNLMEKLKKGNKERVFGKESTSNLITNDLEQIDTLDPGML